MASGLGAAFDAADASERAMRDKCGPPREARGSDGQHTLVEEIPNEGGAPGVQPSGRNRTWKVDLATPLKRPVAGKWRSHIRRAMYTPSLPGYLTPWWRTPYHLGR